MHVNTMHMHVNTMPFTVKDQMLINTLQIEKDWSVARTVVEFPARQRISP